LRVKHKIASFIIGLGLLVGLSGISTAAYHPVSMKVVAFTNGDFEGYGRRLMKLINLFDISQPDKAYLMDVAATLAELSRTSRGYLNAIKFSIDDGELKLAEVDALAIDQALLHLGLVNDLLLFYKNKLDGPALADPVTLSKADYVRAKRIYTSDIFEVLDHLAIGVGYLTEILQRNPRPAPKKQAPEIVEKK
jgi:hypothetical protein